MSQENKMILHYDNSDDVLEFVNSADASRLSQIGAACPDHLVHTKRVPLFVDWNPSSQHVDDLVDRIKAGIERYAETYTAYFNRNKQDGDTMFEPYPRVILIPGIGMVTRGKARRWQK